MHIIGNHHTAGIHLHTVKNAVPGVRILPVGDVGIGRAAVLYGRPHPVCLHQVYPKGIGTNAVGAPAFDEREHIPAHQPRYQSQLLHGVEVVHASGIAGVLAAGPKAELRLGPLLPLLCRLRGEPQRFPVDGRLQCQSDAHRLGAVGVDGRGRQGGTHVKHPAALAQGVVIPVDVLVGAAAVSVKTLQRPPGPAGSGFAVSAGLWAGAIREIKPGSSVLVVNHYHHLIFA